MCQTFRKKTLSPPPNLTKKYSGQFLNVLYLDVPWALLFVDYSKLLCKKKRLLSYTYQIWEKVLISTSSFFSLVVVGMPPSSFPDFFRCWVKLC